MSITWDYYSKRRKINIDSWVRKMSFKNYDQFLSHVSAQGVIPPQEIDQRVMSAIKSISDKDIKAVKEKPVVGKPKAKPAKKGRGKGEKG